MRPLGTYTDQMRTPPHVAPIARGSTEPSNSGWPGRPRVTSSSPTRLTDRDAVPAPVAVRGHGVPAASTSATGNWSAGTLSSCRHSTSGCADSSHASSRSVRTVTELMFHVAMRTSPILPAPTPPALDAARMLCSSMRAGGFRPSDAAGGCRGAVRRGGHPLDGLGEHGPRRREVDAHVPVAAGAEGRPGVERHAAALEEHRGRVVAEPELAAVEPGEVRRLRHGR